MSRYEKKNDMYEDTAEGTAEVLKIFTALIVIPLVVWTAPKLYKIISKHPVLTWFAFLILFLSGMIYGNLLIGLVTIIGHPVQFVEHCYHILNAIIIGNCCAGSEVTLFMIQCVVWTVLTLLVMLEKQIYGDQPQILRDKIATKIAIEEINQHAKRGRNIAPTDKYLHNIIKDTKKNKKGREAIFKSLLEHCSKSNYNEERDDILKLLGKNKICKNLVTSYA